MSNSNKFLFDLNKFDEPDEPEIVEEIIEEEAVPPPPTFSEDELEAAKEIAHTQGKSEGIQEERAKREQELTILLGIISENFSSLFANETYRENAYEHEAVKLALQITKQLAPVLEEKIGAETLKKTITEAIASQSKQSEIIVEVSKSAEEEIKALLDRFSEKHENTPRFKVKGSDDLTEAACQLSWKDGGMIRDPAKTAERIQKELTELLENIKETVPDNTNDDINKGIDSGEDAPIAQIPQQETGEDHD